ncbi:hypothetical protein A33Q_1647 [Indibacter alkaliphilus LW1]|uniref:Uncharacterized protein n=1 Tax=Indibacter alkaliphilus (strain CCUG 57479 / KCTC 22604 / LW1) TaxID=1189612 RepID=S2E6D4_INDAL|nr:hypothetical protein A33Q_1647 [Indibacter alkaliphilus LW1]
MNLAYLRLFQQALSKILKSEVGIKGSTSFTFPFYITCYYFEKNNIYRSTPSFILNRIFKSLKRKINL